MPAGRWPTNVVLGEPAAEELDAQTADYSGAASRFFPVFKYQAKAPTKERPSYINDDGKKVAHSTVKPLALMQWLVRLVTPPNGVVLDPFAGSGTTLEAAKLEGFDSIGIEREAEHIPLIEQRLTRVQEAA
jgi:DNA modification methylase